MGRRRAREAVAAHLERSSAHESVEEGQASMFCPHCGQPVTDRATFCGSCGKPLVEGVHVERAGYHAGKELAAFWPRFGALLLDGLVVTLAAVPIAVVGFAVAFAMIPTDTDEVSTGAAALIIVTGIAAAGVGFGLLWRFHARGTSPGARAAHVRIVDRNGDPPGLGRGLGRLLVAAILSNQILYLGYLWAIWDREKRTWHDHLAGTWVVKDE
ncbi:MAG: zinc-ribbon domain-containing protein [Dehalococcoidia bacterium]|nr:MAG: zinc-ribbon domain-containing protein [Dehalococcoidia bacterium]